MGYLEQIAVGAVIAAAAIIFIIFCCFVYERFVSGQLLNDLPSIEAQNSREQWDGRAWMASRDARPSTRNVIREELGHSGRQGREYRAKSTGDNNLPSREVQHPGKKWDGRSWVESRDPQSSQKQYNYTLNVRDERLKAPITSTRKPTGGNNDSNLKGKKTKNSEELSQQERREGRLKTPVPSAPAVLELENPRSSQGGYRGGFTGEPTRGNNESDLKEKKTRNPGLKAPVPSAPAVLELEKPRASQSGQTCCVCMTQNIEIIFNCAHAATCEECAKSLSVCPICRADITARNRIYLCSGI